MSRILYEMHASIKPKKRHRITNHHLNAARELASTYEKIASKEIDQFGMNK